MRRVNGGLALVLLAGCVSGNVRSAPPVAVRSSLDCAPESFPQRLPGAELLVDTAGLSSSLRELAASSEPADGTVVLTMAYQEDGLNMRRDLLAHDIQPYVADSVQKLVFAHRRTLPEATQEWGVRLLIDLGDPISYRVEHREFCPPRPRDVELETAMSSYLSTGARYDAGARVRTVVFRAAIHPAGYVDGGTVVRGETSGSTMERDLLIYLRQFSFEPATLDGVPVYGHIDVPVRVRL